jgi:c-di-GMP-related signal transduction protein
MKSQSAMLARQPIFDRHVKVTAYEVLFRRDSDWTAPIASPDGATAVVGVHALLDLGQNRTS